MHVFKGRTADEVWRAAYQDLTAVSRQGRVQCGRTGETYELLHVGLEILAPRERWILSRRPALNPAFCIAEVIWILAGSNDASVLNFWFPRLPEFSGTGRTYAGAYGHRLRRHFGIDQIKRACEALAAKPETRQVVLQLWDASTDLPDSSGVPRSADVPCNVCSLLKIREDKLEWTQVMRSNDLLRGFPHNIVQFTTLQEIMAGWLDVNVGTYNHWSDSLHIYTTDSPLFHSLPAPSIPSNLDRLATKPDFGLALIEELYCRLVELSKPELSREELEAVVLMPDAPIAYRNLLLILGSESARRRRQYELSAALAAQCANPQLGQAWKEWERRTKVRTVQNLE